MAGDVPASPHPRRAVGRRAPLSLSRLPPDTPGADLEILLAVLGGLAWAALLLLPLERIAPWLGGCRFHQLTGLPCVGCGSTRGVLALSRGEWLHALGDNPLVVGLLAVLLLYAPVAAGLWIFRRPRPRLRIAQGWPRRTAWALALAAVAANWIYLIAAGR